MKQISTLSKSHQAKAIATALKTCGISIKHTQALKVVAQLEGSRNWNTVRAKVTTASTAPVDLQTIARQHVNELMFNTTGKWTVDSFFDELAATLAMDDAQEWSAKKHRMNKLFDCAYHEGVEIKSPYDTLYGVEDGDLISFYEAEVARVETLLTTRWFAPSAAVVDDALSEFELAHVACTEDVGYENECVVRTASGFQLCSPAFPEPASYLRVCDPLGREIAYWNSDEIQEDAKDVIGAVLGALRPGKAALGVSTPVSETQTCILARRIVDWAIDANKTALLKFREDIPAHRKGVYRMEMFDHGNQFRAVIAPRHRTPEEFDAKKLNCLDLSFEVNEGVPCVHITNDTYGDMVLSIFGTNEGLLVRRQSDTLRFETGANHPLAKLVGAEQDLFIPNQIGDCA